MKRRIRIAVISLLMSLILTATPIISVLGPQATITAEAKKKAKKASKKTKKITLIVGATKKLSLKGGKNYKSSNKGVVSVSKKGVLTANKPGTAKITATYKSGKYTAKVTVPAMSISETAAEVALGSTHSLSVNNAANVAWSSSNPQVATVSGGVVTGVGVGTAVITASAGKASVSCNVTVPQFALNQQAATVFCGDSITLTAGNIQGITWSSSNPQVATVSGGVVTAASAGTAVITAAVGSASATCTVTVPKVTISQEAATINYGDTLTLQVQNATKVTWSSSNTSVATVSGGVIKTVDDGSAVITAAVGSTKVSCNLTVVDPVVINQPTISYQTIIRQAQVGDKLVDEEINQAKIVFNGLPQRGKHMKKIDRSNGKGSEIDGRQNGKYLVVACALAAMTAYSEGRDADGRAMMDELLVSPHISQSKIGGASNLSYYFSYDDKQSKLPWAFFDGSEPYKYNHKQPITVTMEEYPYAPEKSTIYGVELSIEGILFHMDNHPCLKNNLVVKVYQDPTDGQWYLWPSGFASLVSTASIK